MNKILSFLLFSILVLLVLKIIFKITSFVVKVLLWGTIVVLVVFVVNYYGLPLFGKKPYDLEKKFFRPAENVAQKTMKQTVKSVKKEVLPVVEEKIKNFIDEKKDGAKNNKKI